MLKRAQRLRKKRDIERVFRRGRRTSDGFLYVSLLPRYPSGSHRATVIVATKTGLKAVGRNLLRRRARVSLGQELKAINQPHDFVVGFRGRFDKVPCAREVDERLKRCLKKLFSGSSGGTNAGSRRTTAH